MTNELEPLKECPFCPDGGDPRGMTYINESTGEVSDYVKCLKCECETAMYRTKQEATTAWNTRYKRTCKVDWRERDWGVCECGGDVYAHDIHCSQCGRKVSNRSEVVDGDKLR